MTRPRPDCCSARSCRSTATPTSSGCTSTRRPPSSTPTSTRSARSRAAQNINSAADAPVDLDRASASTPTRSSTAHRAAACRPSSGSPSAPTSTRSRRPTGAAATIVTDVTPDGEARGRRRHRHRLPLDGQRPLAARRHRHHGLETSSGTFTFDLPLKPFVDGGWYWYDVVAGERGRRSSVRPSGPPRSPPTAPSTAPSTICITTMNRPDFCAKLLGQLGEDEELRPYLDEVLVMEQGTQLITDSEFFPNAAKALGDKLRVIVQGNLGGSGGYARGQLESVRKGTATYAMMMDDDVICEPEGIIRSVTFGDLARRPTIVGGHMFSIYARSRLHSFGEIVHAVALLVAARPPASSSDWDFSARNLRSTRWLHKRVDVDFNGWFMCLIPRQVLDEIGLVAAALHQVGRLRVRPARQGGRLPDGLAPRCGRVARAVDRQERRPRLAVLLPPAQPLRRGAAALGLPARRPDGAREPQPPDQAPGLDAVLHRRAAAPWRSRTCSPGPTACTRRCPRSSPRSTRSASSSPTRSSRRTRTPSRPYAGTSRRARARTTPGSRAASARLLAAALAPIAPAPAAAPDVAGVPRGRAPRAWTRMVPPGEATTRPSSRCPTARSAALYQRDPENFRDLLKRTLEIHPRFRREWPRLAEEYRAALGDITSPEAWEKTFEPWTTEEMTDAAPADRRTQRPRRRSSPDRARGAAVGAAVGERVWPRSSGTATCCGCWCATPSSRATRARRWAGCGATSSRPSGSACSTSCSRSWSAAVATWRTSRCTCSPAW